MRTLLFTALFIGTPALASNPWVALAGTGSLPGNVFLETVHNEVDSNGDLRAYANEWSCEVLVTSVPGTGTLDCDGLGEIDAAAVKVGSNGYKLRFKKADVSAAIGGSLTLVAGIRPWVPSCTPGATKTRDVVARDPSGEHPGPWSCEFMCVGGTRWVMLPDSCVDNNGLDVDNWDDLVGGVVIPTPEL